MVTAQLSGSRTAAQSHSHTTNLSLVSKLFLYLSFVTDWLDVTLRYLALCA